MKVRETQKGVRDQKHAREMEMGPRHDALQSSCKMRTKEVPFKLVNSKLIVTSARIVH